MKDYDKHDKHEGLLHPFIRKLFVLGSFLSLFPVPKIVTPGHILWVFHCRHCLLRMYTLKLMFMTSYIIFWCL